MLEERERERERAAEVPPSVNGWSDEEKEEKRRNTYITYINLKEKFTF